MRHDYHRLWKRGIHLGNRSKSKKKSQKGHSPRSKAPSNKTTRPVAQPSSHYATLGIAPSADAETIRRRYLELVRQFPPESDPESFQRIRRAYETLTDPKARRQYDKERFYGTTVTKLEIQIDKLENEGRYQDATRLLQQLVDIAPTSQRWSRLADAYEGMGEPTKSSEAYQAALDSAETEEEKVRLMVRRAHERYDRDQDIIARLLYIADQYPNTAPRLIAPDLFQHYYNIRETKKGSSYFRKLISRRKFLTVEEFSVYLDWMHALAANDLFEELDTLFQTKVKSAAKNAAAGPHQQTIKALLADRLDNGEPDRSNFRWKVMVCDLMKTIDPDDASARIQWRAYAELAMITSQMTRLVNDLLIPTPIVKQILDWYGKDYALRLMDEDGYADLDDRPAIRQTLSTKDAISRIQTTYPRLYRAFSSRLSLSTLDPEREDLG